MHVLTHSSARFVQLIVYLLSDAGDDDNKSDLDSSVKMKIKISKTKKTPSGRRKRTTKKYVSDDDDDDLD